MKFSRYIMLALKGCAMGMADVVPGVSGGTIAFISGIYEELIDSIRSIDLQALKLLAKGRLVSFWRHINGRFLLPVLVGIAIAIFSLARLMTYLLTNHPIAIWSFFFGLIVASALLVAQQIGRWSFSTVASLLVGAAIAWWITVATPAETPNDWWFIMLSGAIAICAIVGLCNGLVVSYLKVQPIIATLGMQQVVYGICLVYTGGTPIGSLNKDFTSLASNTLFGVPVLIIIALFVACCFWFLYNMTRHG